jgi:integrating conjugative element protein (TIGR03746 family)
MSKIDSLFDAWKKEDKDQQMIQMQKRLIYSLFLFCGLCLMGWITAPSRMTVYIPPDISNGATLKANAIPEALIYSFAYEIWQEINYWPTDGSQDYEANLHAYWSYLTPAFKSELTQDYETLKTTGQVQRERYMQGMTGAAFDSTAVKKLGNDTWEVDLKMRLTEYKNNQPVKDVEILYPIKITRMDVSHEANPYGLALAGFVSPPVRLKTYI